MGFCRRCGDIVNGQRCSKCGGSVALPAVSWNQVISSEDQDKWSKTYVSRKQSTSPARPKSRGPPDFSVQPSIPSSKRFPLQAIDTQNTGSTLLDNRITNHIAFSASQSTRPPSLKPTVTGPKPESGILPSLIPNDTTLSKVYGSVLQPKESLATHSCAACVTPFLPDATIYPDPSLPASDEPRFLCRPCFIVCGGSKGFCPNCTKPVTILKAEGGFVYAADKYWHKKCFICEGCSKNIGDAPMVDLFGRPSCPGCFDTCLSREPRTPKREKPSKPSGLPERRNLGDLGTSPRTPIRPRESSLAIEELEQRLGIAKSREGSPAIEELSQRLSSIGKDHQPRYSSPSSPLQTRLGRFKSIRLEGLRSPEFDHAAEAGSPRSGYLRRGTESPTPTTKAIDDMKKRFFRHSMASPTLSKTPSSELSPGLSVSLPCAWQPNTPFGNRPTPTSQTEPVSPSSSSTPDFMSDASDSLTESSTSGVYSPPYMTRSLTAQPSRSTRTDLFLRSDNVIIEETMSQLNSPNQTPQSTVKLKIHGTPAKPTTNVTFATPGKAIHTSFSSTSCTKCDEPLFTSKEGGNFVSVPGETTQTFHEQCFRCIVCNGVFNENGCGQAIFVNSSAGPAHVECAPPEKALIRKSPSTGSLRFSQEKVPLRNDHTPTQTPSPLPGNHSSSRFERPPPIFPAMNTVPRFGSRSSCPGCHKFVSPMEKGVIPGPQGSKWHTGCLVCGGKRPPTKSYSWVSGRGNEKKKEPGCGKKLDSAAKTDADGRIWCRECLLMLGAGGPLQSPTRTPLELVSACKPVTQLNGTTTLARQFTGLGNSDAGLLKQLTGGSISPTRSLSPTKQLNSSARPRPRSVIGTRSSRSVDEGRGMFLVRQLSGASSSDRLET